MSALMSSQSNVADFSCFTVVHWLSEIKLSWVELSWEIKNVLKRLTRLQLWFKPGEGRWSGEGANDRWRCDAAWWSLHRVWIGSAAGAVAVILHWSVVGLTTRADVDPSSAGGGGAPVVAGPRRWFSRRRRRWRATHADTRPPPPAVRPRSQHADWTSRAQCEQSHWNTTIQSH